MFVCFRLKPGRDDDLIEMLQNTQDRSQYIREALRGKKKSPAREPPERPKNTKPDVPDNDLEANLDGWL